MTKTDDRNWRDAKIPNWVADSVESELRQYRLTVALSWPTEVKPGAVPFQWGPYDRLSGEPVAGVYWSATARGVEKVEIEPNEDKIGTSWKSWKFKADGRDWSTSVVRGPLFNSEREAVLYRLWVECESAAKHLMKLRERLYE